MLLVAVRLGLWIAPFASLRRWTARLARPPDTSPGAVPLPAERIAWAVSAVGRRVPGGQNCLAQAVAAAILLGRHGYTPHVRIGLVRRGMRGFEAHAWVEQEGSVLLGGPDVSQFAPLPPFENETP